LFDIHVKKLIGLLYLNGAAKIGNDLSKMQISEKLKILILPKKC